MKLNLRTALAGAAALSLFSAGAGFANPSPIAANDTFTLAQADATRSETNRSGNTTTNTASPSRAGDKNVGMAAGRIDTTRVAAGMRADKVIGSQVYNSTDESIGTIDDLIIEPNDRVVYAIVSVGGFLGVGDRLVAVPFDQISFQRRDENDTRLILANSTKAQLEAMPQFRYAR